uniref:3-deoxy-D-manno-octulosonic acid transferase n=1 Tax=Roseihalotalea indica TaxID=2867963 RepID=A0AA49GTX0_9BACT|nr:glycosyltransferase N-terminal domain-containing protein [Tunicatimonas sp. TK19036]
MWLYQIIISLLKAGLYISLPFSEKNRKFVQGRQGVFARIRHFAKQPKHGPCFWFHCASLGEFEQGRPVIESLKQQYPDACVVLTFFSPSGYEVRKDYELADLVCYLPLDGYMNARKFIKLVQPTVALFVKYEYWYGYLRELKKREIPTLSISTHFREDAVPFKWYGGFYRRMLRMVSHYFVQDELSGRLLQDIGIRSTTLAGDTRFDRVAALCQQAESVELAEKFKQSESVMVVGSNWPPDTEVLLPFIREFEEKLKFIIAPHNIEEEHLTRIEENMPYKTVRYSRAKINTVSNYRVLIIDNVGMLTSLYRYGDFAYVGGAFGKSLHNVLEAATFGMPLFFGNRSYQHVREATDLLKLNAAFTVNDTKDLRYKFLTVWNDEEKREKMAEISQNYVHTHTGATNKVVGYLEKYLA